MRAAVVVSCFHELFSARLLGSADPDPRGTVSSGSALFAIIICVFKESADYMLL